MLNTLPSTVDIIATSNEEVEEFLAGAALRNMAVRQTNVWIGPVPPNSLVWIAPGVSMATPEYMLLRKANQLPHDEALVVCCALLSHYDTFHTSRTLGRDEVFRRDEPHTTFKRIVEYLMPIMATPEAKACFDVAHEALRYLPSFESWCEERAR